MPTRAELEKQLRVDEVRRGYLKQLQAKTGRDVILYATAFTSLAGTTAPPWSLNINPQDVQSFMAALHGLRGGELDLVLHSPGGSLEASEQILTYLRRKYGKIRAIIPQNAMSAATMIACACDEIVMGKHSAIGPTDPQLTFRTGHGTRIVPAHAVVNEFGQALKSVAADPKLSTFWAARFQHYPPGLFHDAQDTIKKARSKLKEWLVNGALAGPDDRSGRATQIADWLSEAANHSSHGQPICIATAQGHGLNVVELEADPDLQDLVLSVYHAASLTFDVGDCVKIVENHEGRGTYLRVSRGAPTGPQACTVIPIS